MGVLIEREPLRRFHGHRILAAVAEASFREGAAIPEGFLAYKTALGALERIRSDRAAPRR